MKTLIFLVTFSFFFLVRVEAQTNLLKNEKQIEKFLSKVGFPNQELQEKAISCIVFAVIHHDKKGRIDSIVTSSKNDFGKHIKEYLNNSNGYWYIRGRYKKMPIVIPFIFLGLDEVKTTKQTVSEALNVSDYYRWLKTNAFECVFHTPIIILGDQTIAKK